MSYCYNCFQEHNAPGPCPHCGYDPAADAGKFPHALPHGTILAGQLITGRVLGQGGFGITYLALDNRSGDRVALKEFLPDTMAGRSGGSLQVTAYSGDRGQQFQYGLDCFLDEAKTLAKFLGNPNIVGVRSYFQENGTAYFTMDYIDGISLKALLQEQGGRIDWEEAVRLMLPVMDALEVVHREGLIHRDVTPDNIYISRDGQVKLLDFGAARYSLGDRSRSLDVVLKPGYAPKEQYVRRGRQGPYTDVYSVGACFYAVITGSLPPEALERMEEDELVPPSTRGIKLSPALEDAILKALEIQPQDRYQSMSAFSAAVRASLPAADRRETVPPGPERDDTPSGYPHSVFDIPPATVYAGPPVDVQETVTSYPQTDDVTAGYPYRTDTVSPAPVYAGPPVSVRSGGSSPRSPQKPGGSARQKPPMKFVITAAFVAFIAVMLVISSVSNRSSGNKKQVVPPTPPLVSVSIPPELFNIKPTAGLPEITPEPADEAENGEEALFENIGDNVLAVLKAITKRQRPSYEFGSFEPLIGITDVNGNGCAEILAVYETVDEFGNDIIEYNIWSTDSQVTYNLFSSDLVFLDSPYNGSLHLLQDPVGDLYVMEEHYYPPPGEFFNTIYILYKFSDDETTLDFFGMWEVEKYPDTESNYHRYYGYYSDRVDISADEFKQIFDNFTTVYSLDIFSGAYDGQNTFSFDRAREVFGQNR